MIIYIFILYFFKNTYDVNILNPSIDINLCTEYILEEATPTCSFSMKANN